MDAITPETIATIMGQLGLSAVFFYLLMQERRDKQKVEERLEQMTNAVLVAFTENSKVQEGVKLTIENNNDAMSRMTSSIDQLLRIK